MLRKIRKNEIRSAAKAMAECFNDYPLYDVFFPNSPHRLTQVFYFFWFRIYTRRDSTYISDDGAFLASCLHPGEKPRSALGLLLNPFFLFGFLRYIPLSALRLVREYSRMEEAEQKKFYDPAEDWYIQAICVLKDARSSRMFRRVYDEINEGQPLFCETHAKRNARLYRMLGFRICSETEWHGVTHYVMRRDRVLPAADETQPNPQ